MERASLNYIITSTQNGEKVLSLESSTLNYIDNFTSKYKNYKDFIENYDKKELIKNFIIENNFNSGNLKIHYFSDFHKTVKIPVLFDSKDEINMSEDLLSGKITEFEKARKLLFNSRNQLFAKIFLTYKPIEECFFYKMSITEEECYLAIKHGIECEEKDNHFFISFRDLIEYRAHNNRLGNIRNLYEDMLEIWKENVMGYKKEEFYYYSRQIRILLKYYNELKSKTIGIKNLILRKELSRGEKYYLSI